MSGQTTAQQQAEEAAIKLAEQKPNGSLLLPAVTDVLARSKAFIQNAEHVTQDLYALCQLFFEEELKVKRKWFDGVSTLLNEKYGEEDEFTRFGVRAIPFMKFLRNARHCVEHHNLTQCVDVKDFMLTADGSIAPPTIEVIHSETPQPRVPLRQFMEQISRGLLNVSESLTAFLCSKHVQELHGFPVQVAEIPEEKRRNKKVRFGYAVWMGDQLVLAS
jgi:hypothetical protein